MASMAMLNPFGIDQHPQIHAVGYPVLTHAHMDPYGCFTLKKMGKRSLVWLLPDFFGGAFVKMMGSFARSREVDADFEMHRSPDLSEPP